MSDETSKDPHPFDVQTIKRLVSLMSRHDLSEIDLKEGDARIRLRRGPEVVQGIAPTPSMIQPAATAATPAAPSAPTDSASAEDDKNYVYVKSPTPGTFYAQEKPGAEPFVKVGSRVSPNTVVGLIEAMKLYNQVEADCSGVVVEILVEDSQFVEYDTPLLKIDPAG